VVERHPSGGGVRHESREAEMPIFPSRGALAFLRSGAPLSPAPTRDLPEHLRAALPLRFEAVAEALMSKLDVTAPCSVVGRDVARDGALL
jgi:hypothetical protein